MSTLNKAFIKAYQRRTIGAPHIPLSGAPQPVRDEAAVADAGGTDALEPAVENGLLGPEQTATLEPKTIGNPTAKAEWTPKPERTPETEVTPDLDPATDIEPVAEAEWALAPSDSGSEIEHYFAPSGHLVPAFEVERFEWPQAVTALIKNSSQLGALIGELLPDGHGTLVVSGCRRGEGRTSVALLLGRYLGRRGTRVAIVDADVEQPQLASRLGMLVEAGWETSITGELPAGEALIESLRDRLTLVPFKRPVSELHATGMGACLKELIERLQTQFDVICLDAGPLAVSDETGHESLFGQTPIDAAVVVRDIRHCRPEQAHAVGRKLAQLGVNRWAVVENFCGVGAPSV